MTSAELRKLADPFAEDDLEWRIQRAGIKDGKPWGMALVYVTNRAIMQRLDDVVGPENWQNEYKEGPQGGVLCGLSIRVDDRWITKWDGAENTDIEAIKGGLSDAMKRAAVQWGIGRYLYKVKENWAVFHASGQHTAKIKDKDGPERFVKWDPPKLSAEFLPIPSNPPPFKQPL